MSSADRKKSALLSMDWMSTGLGRYGLALAAVAAATLFRYPLGKLIGGNLPFVLCYPTVLFVAWMAGLGPGLFAVSLSVMSVHYFFFGRIAPFALGLPRNGNGLLLFSIAGLAISWWGDFYRRREKRLEGVEKAVEGLEEMIVVVDRNYRYVIANRAFWNYRGMKKQDLI